MTDYPFHPEAKAEYLDAFARYGLSSISAAIGFEQAIGNAFQKMTAMPKAFPLLDRRHRMFLLKNYPYYLVYRESAAGLFIVAVAHTSREHEYWKGR